MPNQRMIPGRVVRIRVNPTDCMAVLDVIEKLGLTPDRLSFDQAVRITLSSLLESVRKNGIIPTRDGFEYSDMMQSFRMPKVNTEEVFKIAAKLGTHAAAVQPIVPETPERARNRVRLRELKFRANTDMLNMTLEEKLEYADLQGQFMGEDFSTL